ncbi:hypothetical protein WJX74_003567 [Apatococcus lobatus]|uniref:Uncharacterized protein n=1 Tax=Apatococcus lobatus TaxID=904363 RepID=A0AAW1RZR4_9CHLO
MTWGDFFATVLAGGAAATAAFATYRANQEVAALRAEEEARLRTRQPRVATRERPAGMDPPDARAWAYSQGAPVDFLRHVEEHEQRTQRLPQHGEHSHHHHHFMDENNDGGWGAEPDLPEFPYYPQYSQHAHEDGSSGYHGYPRPRQAAGMDTFEELFALMHDHAVGARRSPRQANPHELLEEMRTRGHPEGWEPELWGNLEHVHEMMMRRLGGAVPSISVRFSGGQTSEVMDPLAMQLSLMDRDFTDADYEMLSRLDDPARNPSNRTPLTQSQLSELPVHTYQTRKAPSHGQREVHSPSPACASSSSAPGNTSSKPSMKARLEHARSVNTLSGTDHDLLVELVTAVSASLHLSGPLKF